jgi:hypothetical protein
MMNFCNMSSNGFLSAPELSFREISWRSIAEGNDFQARLSVNAAGAWHIRVSDGPRAVLLLRYSSFWTSRMAVLTLRYSDGARSVLWARRTEENDSSWRRMRTWFRLG